MLGVPAEGTSVAGLVRAAGAGDGRAWEALVDRYAALVWSIVRNFRLQSGDASDVSQTTWLRLVENIDRLHDPERVGAWLATTARRECLRVLAQSDRQVLYGDEGAFDVSEPADMDLRLIAAEQAEELHRALAQLPERHQRLMRLFMLDPPPSYDEITAVLGIPIGSIGPTRGRCLAKLRVLLEADGVAIPTRRAKAAPQAPEPADR